MSKKENIENLLYNGDLNLDELIGLKEDMKEYEFKDSDMEYVDELILEQIDLIEDLNEIIKLKDRYKSNSNLFDKVINKRNILNIKAIEDMNKEELEYILYDCELSVVDLLRLFTCMKKYDFNDFANETVKDYLKESIEDKELDELKEIRKEALKYNADTKLLDDYIKAALSKKYKRNKKSGVSLSKALLMSFLLSDTKGANHSDSELMPWEEDAVKDGGYEPFNFEEENLEEDDFYYDDLD